MFRPSKRDVGKASIEQLVALMERRTRTPALTENDHIPAGFTYLGQFIDHDITFDATPIADRHRDPEALVNFRTPRFDLDSVYGSGPVAQPYLYDWEGPAPRGARLLLGENAVDSGSADPLAPIDLPRNQQGRALIGDPRNAENVVVAQLHLLLIRFHNAVVERVGDFEEARRIVRWHYQWIVVHDFLPRVVGEEMATEVLEPASAGNAPVVHCEHFEWQDEPFIPVEFSAAAYRFGHSTVRDRYGLKRRPEGAPVQTAIPLFPDLARSTWLPERLVIDWQRFFSLAGAHRPQSSFRIDTTMSEPLFRLPDDGGILPRRNLLRGRELQLPSGQEVASAMKMSALPEEALLLDDEVPSRSRKALLATTPLWYYVLCEAAHAAEGRHLGPVGGRIVAEVLVGLLEGDPDSYLSMEPAWRPEELGHSGDFGMAALIEVVPP
jgi:hypothetical protein